MPQPYSKTLATSACGRSSPRESNTCATASRRRLPGANMNQPDQVLAKLNDVFQGEHHGERFFTIWYGVHQCASRTMTWSGGGLRRSLREGHVSVFTGHHAGRAPSW